VAPLRLRGLRGKQSTPSDWLGGTGVVSTAGERERYGEQERHGAWDAAWSAGHNPKLAKGNSKILFLVE
jgi:hypothetical protein